MKRLNEILKLTGAAFLGALLAGSLAWAATGSVIFGAAGGAATVTNGKLDVNLAGGSGGTVILGAGSALVGKVGIDQTTPDSTNLVSNKLSVATFVSGTATQTSTTSTSLIGAVSLKSIYVTSWNCANSGASASTIVFQDGSGGTTLAQTYNPAGGGSNSPGGGILFKTTAGNALFFAPGTGSTTQSCSAAGFSQ